MERFGKISGRWSIFSLRLVLLVWTSFLKRITKNYHRLRKIISTNSGVRMFVIEEKNWVITRFHINDLNRSLILK